MAGNAKPRPRLRVVKNDSRLTPEFIGEFCALVEKGMPFDGACDFLTLTYATFHEWMRKGEIFLDDGAPEEFAIYGDFVQAVRKSSAKYRLALIEDAHRPGNRNWFRPLYILERRDRRTFGRWVPQGGGDDALDPDEKFL